MTNPIECLIENISKHIQSSREAHEQSMNYVSVPGSTVYVLHDGRRGWMEGEAGTVESVDDQWATGYLKGRGTLKFRL